MPSGFAEFSGVSYQLGEGREQKFYRVVRAGGIGLLVQDGGRTLHPTRRIGEQLREMLALGGGIPSASQLRDSLAEVELPDAARMLRAYPHELSGGQKQRVALSLVLAQKPKILLADEPTTALDPIRRELLLTLLASLKRDRGLAMVLVTHDMRLASRSADRILVLQQGRCVEEGPSGAVFASPKHPYTEELLQGTLTVRGPKATSEPSAQEPVDAAQLRLGCHYVGRCPREERECRVSAPQLEPAEPDWSVACHRVLRNNPSAADKDIFHEE
jgi:oligopeptide/dipeptide ABC transporter ATP-binding protein